MSLDYQMSEETIKQRLEVAHNPKQAKIRAYFFEKEFAFFKNHIVNQAVLVAGSGLGQDSFELAQYNKKVVGIELLDLLVQESRKTAKNIGITNVFFEQGDFTKLNYVENYFDSAVLNMGTIGNFDNKLHVIQELLRVAKKVYFDFYPPLKKGLETRRRMYAEEKWINVRIEGTMIKSDDGLESKSIDKKEITDILKSINAKVKYYPICEFSIIAEISK